jgi:hypothetical protein
MMEVFQKIREKLATSDGRTVRLTIASRRRERGPEYSYDPYGDAEVEVIAEAVQVLDGRG